jgi:hypothetical protein
LFCFVCKLSRVNSLYPSLTLAKTVTFRYSKKCKIPAHILYENRPNPVFYDLYIPYQSDTSNSGTDNKLIPVPVMILSKSLNQDRNSDKRELTTRFFMVDTLTGRPLGKEDQRPDVVRYLKKFEIQ